MELRERVARVLAGKTFDGFKGWDRAPSRSDYIEQHWDRWLDHADAVIAAVEAHHGQGSLL